MSSVDRRSVYVVDPGFLPTTRQMAVAVADTVAAYFDDAEEDREVLAA